MLFSYQGSFRVALGDSLFIIAQRFSFVNNFFKVFLKSFCCSSTQRRCFRKDFHNEATHSRGCARASTVHPGCIAYFHSISALLGFGVIHSKRFHGHLFDHLRCSGTIIKSGRRNRNRIYRFHALDHLTERRILSIQMG